MSAGRSERPQWRGIRFSQGRRVSRLFFAMTPGLSRYKAHVIPPSLPSCRRVVQPQPTISLVLTLAATLALLLASCAGRAAAPNAAPARAPETAPAAAPASVRTTAPATVAWEDKGRGIRLCYPGDWQPKRSPDYDLMLIQGGASPEDRRITLDVPDLPPHLPWMIQMSRIQHDYLEDIRKSHPDLRLDEAADARVPNAVARLVRSSWRQGRQVENDVALLMIHNNAVYILNARADQPHLPATRNAFDSIESSLRWTKG